MSTDTNSNFTSRYPSGLILGVHANNPPDKPSILAIVTPTWYLDNPKGPFNLIREYRKQTLDHKGGRAFPKVWWVPIEIPNEEEPY